MKQVLVLTGLTATGKSKLAIDWAKYFDGEIISADSVAVYRQLSIVSAKPDSHQRSQVVHHGIDLVDVDRTFTIKDFRSYVIEKIDDISNRGKLPIIVGGSGLYLKAVLYDYEFSDEIRQDDSWAEEISNEELHGMLAMIDPKEAQKIHPNNRKRIIRALTIYKAQKTPKSQIIDKQQHQLQYDVLMFCAYLNKDRLHQQIDTRVDHMIQQGLELEIRNALRHATWEHPSMAAIGVKEFRPYFEQEATLEQVSEQIKIRTKQFSKRQRTWFKHQFDAIWIDMDDPRQISDAFQKVTSWIKR